MREISPRLILTSLGSGTDLQVEALGVEAINVRLVPIQSENYQLRSEIIRYLRVGKPETLILRCESRREGGSPALRTLSFACSFFSGFISQRKHQ